MLQHTSAVAPESHADKVGGRGVCHQGRGCRLVLPRVRMPGALTALYHDRTGMAHVIHHLQM